LPGCLSVSLATFPVNFSSSCLIASRSYQSAWKIVRSDAFRSVEVQHSGLRTHARQIPSQKNACVSLLRTAHFHAKISATLTVTFSLSSCCPIPARLTHRHANIYPVVFEILRIFLAVFFTLQGGPEKTAQSLLHQNFETVSHSVTWFTPKCSEIKSEHGNREKFQLISRQRMRWPNVTTDHL